MSEAFNIKLKKEKQITILALNWRDIKNPMSGGAEIHAHEMFSRNSDIFQIVHLSPKYQGCMDVEIIDGVRYIRKGNIVTVIVYALLYYQKNKKVIDFVIDQCNAHRFFTYFYVERKKRIFYTHQLYRELWFIMASWPVSQIGFMMEVPMLKLNRKDQTITVSESTKRELIRIGYKDDKITIVPNAINIKPLPYEKLNSSKEKIPIFIYVGRYANSKGMNYAVEAIGKLKQLGRNIKFLIVGRENKNYINKVLQPICKKYQIHMGKSYESDIIICGHVSEETKRHLLEKSHALLLPSKREGWGIVIIEAALLGTPSIVFCSPGCIDAVDYGRAGYLCHKNTSDELVKYMIDIMDHKKQYEMKRRKAYSFSSRFSWEESSNIFRNLVYKMYLEN